MHTKILVGIAAARIWKSALQPGLETGATINLPGPQERGTGGTPKS